MTSYLLIILGYLLVLAGINYVRSRHVRTQSDFMVAGRQLKTPVLVFTLICTWIGSGTFIAGAEFAAKAGFSALWWPAGGFIGIVLIYFLAGKIRTFGQFTIGDILEERYGPLSRIAGAIALVISFVAIVSYQFLAGGFILNVATDGAISAGMGTLITALFVIAFTILGGMVAVAYTDLPNGIIIVLACLVSVPFVYFAAGGLSGVMGQLPQEHFHIINKEFGNYPLLKVIGYVISNILLLLGVQTMYQKFYSARTPKDAKRAVIYWTGGTVIVETIVIVIAVFSYSVFMNQLDLSIPREGGKVILMAAKNLVPVPVGVLLLGAACAVVISTGMNYLLSPSSSIIRDVYQRFIRSDASQSRLVALQKAFVVIIGVLAFFLALKMKSVLDTAFFAYTVYGVAITPPLIAALVWKRATRTGGLAAILSGTVVCIVLKVASFLLPASMVPDGDPWGIPIVYPALFASLTALIGGSLLTPKPSLEVLKKFFPDQNVKDGSNP